MKPANFVISKIARHMAIQRLVEINHLRRAVLDSNEMICDISQCDDLSLLVALLDDERHIAAKRHSPACGQVLRPASLAASEIQSDFSKRPALPLPWLMPTRPFECQLS